MTELIFIRKINSITSEKRGVKGVGLCPRQGLAGLQGVLPLALRFAELDVCCEHVAVLRLVEVFSLFEVVFKNRKIRPPYHLTVLVVLGNLWFDGTPERGLLVLLLN